MLSERHSSSTHDDRALRGELEQLQGELRRVRASITAAPATLAAAEKALETSLASAHTRRDAAAAQLASLEVEAQALERACAQLDERVEAKRKEDELLALGASRRNEYVEWFPQNVDRRLGIRDVRTLSPEQLARNRRRYGLVLLVMGLLYALGMLVLTRFR